MHTVLGRPFLADNNIRLDFSQKKGEIFSYIELDGKRLCLPIFSPQKVGWREDQPKGMEACGVSKLEDFNEPKETEDETKGLLTEQQFPWEGYINLKPLSNFNFNITNKALSQDNQLLPQNVN
ncbi:hypothetical protein O181_133135 [Austropuccinia psidii MF-1]|uniref:Uncharacterized protein n=1 Tax=Austropuccinia psidii MF-1 TaxID=1389203 RepID=A0A9Q3QDD4_9BASI|nr:hypothetical protein [Austropuccinia psidii MF-1]